MHNPDETGSKLLRRRLTWKIPPRKSRGRIHTGWELHLCEEMLRTDEQDSLGRSRWTAQNTFPYHSNSQQRPLAVSNAYRHRLISKRRYSLWECSLQLVVEGFGWN